MATYSNSYTLLFKSTNNNKVTSQKFAEYSPSSDLHDNRFESSPWSVMFSSQHTCGSVRHVSVSVSCSTKLSVFQQSCQVCQQNCQFVKHNSFSTNVGITRVGQHNDIEKCHSCLKTTKMHDKSDQVLSIPDKCFVLSSLALLITSFFLSKLQ